MDGLEGRGSIQAELGDERGRWEDVVVSTNGGEGSKTGQGVSDVSS